MGSWFGPVTISQVLKVLVDEDESCPLKIHISSDGVLYRDELRADAVLSTTQRYNIGIYIRFAGKLIKVAQ